MVFVCIYDFSGGGDRRIYEFRVRGPMAEIAVTFRALVFTESPKTNADSERLPLNLLGMQVCKMTSVM